MTWQERDDAAELNPGGAPSFGGMGGDWQGIRPTLDNPLSWALSLGRIPAPGGPITIRVHVIFLAFIIIELMQSLSAPSALKNTTLDFKLTAVGLGALIIVVLLHEFGHCLACRRMAGEADEILLWPLGGLAHCRPPNAWSAHLATAAGGPLTNLVICAVLTPVIGLASGKWWAVAIPNPLDVAGGVKALGHPWWLIAVYQLNAMSFVLLWFNLLPMFPLDGGRILQACLWSRLGFSRAMRVAVRVGFVGSLLLGILGAAQQEWSLVAVALLGAMTCYGTHRQLEFTDEVMGSREADFALTAPGRPSPRQQAGEESALPGRDDQRQEQQRQRQEEEARELDRVLQKIAQSGMGSLTGSERRLLKRATRRRREEK